MKSTVAVLRTSPKKVVEDYGRLMRLAGYRNFLNIDRKTFLKVNISWTQWYPAASTEPWQLEGTLRTLVEDGFSADSVSIIEGRLPGRESGQAEAFNGLATVAERMGVAFEPVKGRSMSWVPFTPEKDLMVLDRMTGEESVNVPDEFMGNNLVHLPTAKTHWLSGIAGSAMSTFDALLDGQWEHGDINSILVDLLVIQKELCGGLFTVTDATICGDGPGPRTLIPYEKGYILAGADPVAVDAVAAGMMGFDPMAIDYIRIASERGVGQGSLEEVNIVGDDISDVNFHFTGGSRPRVPASDAYLEYYWYPFRGWRHVGRIAETQWGQLLQAYLPPGAELEHQGKGKTPLLAMAAAAALLGLSATRRVARMARRGA